MKKKIIIKFNLKIIGFFVIIAEENHFKIFDIFGERTDEKFIIYFIKY